MFDIFQFRARGMGLPQLTSRRGEVTPFLLCDLHKYGLIGQVQWFIDKQALFSVYATGCDATLQVSLDDLSAIVGSSITKQHIDCT